jgi:hypothetical protein
MAFSIIYRCYSYRLLNCEELNESKCIALIVELKNGYIILVGTPEVIYTRRTYTQLGG